jgi:DnaD/phage-associated family protein
LTENEVVKAWRHWEKQGLVALDDTDAQLGITFLSPPEQPVSAAPKKPKTPNLRILPPIQEKPSYSADELDFFKSKNSDVSRLFARAEQTLGKLLSYNDMNVIFGLHDWLRLPVDVVEYLLVYCAEADKRNLRYIEKVALDWADNEIFDLESALEYVQNFDRSYREIMTNMGLPGYPTPTHRKFMARWLHEYNFSPEMISLAIEKCIIAIDKPKFSYVEKILAGWHGQGVKTPEAANEQKAPAKVESKATPAAKPKTSRFANFTQREIDFAKLERLEREYQLKMYAEAAS